MLLFKDFFFALNECQADSQEGWCQTISYRYLSIMFFMSDSCLYFALLALPFSYALGCVSAVLLLSAMGRPFPCLDCVFIRVHACFFLVLNILYFTVLPHSAPPNAWKSSESKFTFLPHAISSWFLFLAQQPVSLNILGDSFQGRYV